MTRPKLLFLLLMLPAAVAAQNMDINLLKAINLGRIEQLDGFFRFMTNSAVPLTYGVPLLLLVYALLRKNTSVKQKGLYISTSVIITAAVTTILKYSIDKPRPFITYPLIENISGGGTPSFPSGHTSDAFVLATALSLAYPRWYVIIPAYAWAGAVGYSRMHLGVHYPSDVAAGAVIGAGCAYLYWKSQQKRLKTNNP